MSEKPEGPRGVGGWLWLHIPNFILLTLIFAVSALSILNGYEVVLEPYKDPSSPHCNLHMQTYLIIGFGISVLLILLNLGALVTMIMKYRSFRLFASAVYVMIFIYYSFDAFLVEEIGGFGEEETIKTYGQVFGSALSAGLWIPYFWISRRVQNTFVK